MLQRHDEGQVEGRLLCSWSQWLSGSSISGGLIVRDDFNVGLVDAYELASSDGAVEHAAFL
jgi:hypothetical protein